MGAPKYDVSAWPIFRVTMPSDGMTEAQAAAHLSTLARLLGEGRRFVILVDARGAKPMPAKQRAAVAQLLKQSFEREPHVLVGVGVVLSSAIERGVLTAILWATGGRSCPTQPHRTPEEATAWLQTLLGAP